MEPPAPWPVPSPATDPPARPFGPAAREPFGPAGREPVGPPRRGDGQGSGNGRKRSIGAALAALAALGAKLKALLLLLPKLKLFASAGTMLVSIAAYTVVFGFPFAVGFVVLLLVHELGHVIALRREGIKATPPMFVPFLGAVISAKSLGGSALAEARVGLAGPILGSVGALGCVVLHHATGNDLFRALAFTGFFLNLFNLLPVVPLDGGRAMAAMAPWMWLVGLAAMVAVAFVFPNPVMLIILVFAGLETWRRYKLRRTGGAAQEAYYRVKPVDRLLVGAVYIALVALLAAGIHGTVLPRSF